MLLVRLGILARLLAPLPPVEAEPYSVWVKIRGHEGAVLGYFPLVQLPDRRDFGAAVLTQTICEVILDARQSLHGMRVINNFYEGEIQQLAAQLRKLMMQKFLLTSDDIPTLVPAEVPPRTLEPLPIKYEFDVTALEVNGEDVFCK